MNKWQQAIDDIHSFPSLDKRSILQLIRDAKQLQQERDQLAARCELLRKFGAGWAERAGADDQAWDYLSDLSSGVYSLAHHDAELLRSVADELDKEMDGDLGETIDDWDHGYDAGYMRAVDRITRIADQLEREQ